jgi:long-chain acyl-CoA synthetase
MTDATARTLPDLLALGARRFAERPAIASREGLRTRTMTYRDLCDAANSVAAALGGQGLRKGQRVILLAPPGVRTVCVLFGLFRAGVVAVPLDLNSTLDFVAAVARKTEAAGIIVARGLPVPAGLPRIAIEDLPLGPGGGAPTVDVAPDDVAEIVFTSGTTGDPKGVVLTHLNILSDLEGAAMIVPRGEEMRLLSILPLSHMFEQTVGLFLPILKGGTVHYASSLKPSSIVGEMRRWRVTGMVVVPRFLALLMTAAEETARKRGQGRLWDLQQRLAPGLPMTVRRLLFTPLHRQFGGRLRYFLCGGAALPADVMTAWERTGIRIVEGYGATECAPVIASNTFDDRMPGSIGHPLSGVSVRLSDEGEIQVRGPNVFSGYWQDPERTRAAFTPDGWYRTEDVADRAGDRLKIVGRLSDRIVLPSGMKVYPGDVETRLSQEPGVRECVILGVPDERGGERLHAAIRPAEGSERTAIAQAVERANASLASHQRIMGFTLWADEFPKTALQKVKRKQLKAALAGAAGAADAPPAVDPVGLAGRLLRHVLKTAPGEIGAEARLDADLGLDSLGRVELAAEIERATGRDVPEDSVARLVTAGDLAALLARPGAPATPLPFPTWPRNPAVVALRRALQPPVLFLPHRLFARPYRVTGAGVIADIEGPVLFIANHASHADTLAVLRALPAGRRARTAVAAAADYFFRSRVAAVLAPTLIGAFPFSREGRVRESFEACGRLADEGWSILLYPEGTRSPDGRLLPFKSGIGLLSTGLGLPVVPVAVTGGATLLPKGASWPRRAAVSVRFGKPVTLPPDISPLDATATLQRLVEELLTDEIDTAIGGTEDA